MNEKFLSDKEFKAFVCCLEERLKLLGSTESSDLSLVSSNTNRVEEVSTGVYTFHRRQDIELLTQAGSSVVRNISYPNDNGKIFYCYLQDSDGTVTLNLPTISANMVNDGFFIDVIIEGDVTTDSFNKSEINCDATQGFGALGPSTKREFFADKIGNGTTNKIIINDYIDLTGVQFRFVASRDKDDNFYWLEVKKHLPPIHDYSTVEKYTKENWIDGSKIYEKTIALSNWTTSGDESGSSILQVGGELIDVLIDLTFRLKSTGATGLKTTLKYGDGSSWQGGAYIALVAGDQTLIWENMYDPTNIASDGPFQVWVTLKYTKI